MLNKIISFSLNNKLFILLAAILPIVFGTPVATRFYLVATIPTGSTCHDKRREAQPNVVNLRLKALYPLA
jgi:Cu/Ag efflux pump CusA